MSSNANAVWISKAEKSYVKFKGKPLNVFQDVNMTVPHGCIYGLLGPSGCGKTSILRCIVGRQRFDKGQLLVLGYPPGSEHSKVPGSDVGYMPQETCLIDTMTIAENIWYFGAIVNLSDEEIKTRMAYYENLLRLPSTKTLISNLSGGQARRVSLTVALLHEPKLIILDEPTVGIDPIVKMRIWNHLIDLVHLRRASIILTTHYIEEACNAHRVGLMHAGTIVAEDSSDNLLRRYNCDKLEDVFLKLSARQEGCNKTDIKKTFIAIPKIVITKSSSHPSLSEPQLIEEFDISEARPDFLTDHPVTPKRSFARNTDYVTDHYLIPKGSFVRDTVKEFRIRRRPLQSIIMKNILFLIRFPGALLCLILLPCMSLFLFHTAYEGPIQPLVLKVVNEDLGHMGKELMALMDPKSLILNSYESLKDANKIENDAYGVLYINKNFSENLMERQVNGIFRSKHALEAKNVQLYIDNAFYHIKIRMVYEVLNAFKKFLTAVTNSSSEELPIIYNSDLYSFLENPTFRQATFNVATILIHFIAFGGTVLLFFVELKKGYVERNFVAGTTSAELFFGLMTVQSVVMFIVSISNTILFVIFYHEDIKGSWTLIFFLFYTISLSGSLFGFVISVAIDSFYQITLIGVLCVISAGCTTCAYYPVQAMPYFFQYFCKATPLFFPLQALKNIIHYGFGLSHLSILSAFLISFLWMGIFMLLFVILFNSLRTRGL